MIRVLHLINWLNVGGLEKRLMALLAEIPRDRVAMDIVCKGRGTGIMAPQAEQLGARVYHCPLTPFHVGFVRGLGRIIREGNYDIVHNQLGAAAGVGTWVARRCGAHVITSFVSTNSSFRRWRSKPVLGQLNRTYTSLSIRYAVNHSDFVTGNSAAVLDSIVPDHRQRSNCLVLHGGVHLNVAATEQERAAVRQELGLPADCRLVLHVGRFTVEKNHAGVIEIFRRVAVDRAGAHLLLVGDGPLVDEVRQRIEMESLQDRVHLLGLRHDIPRLMRCSDVFLLPSHFEGLPVTVLEALASSLPVVASDIPGTAEVIRNGETGLLQPVEQVDALAASLVRMLSEPELAARLAAQGRALIESHFSVAAAAERHVKLYERCMQLDQPAGAKSREVSQTPSPRVS